MYRVLCVLCVAFTAAFGLERGEPCTTPNEETAKCISINDCQVIQRAIKYLEEDAIDFAKKSQCGYDDSPLVCCGTEGKAVDPQRTTTPLPRLYEPVQTEDTTYQAEPIRHILLPDSSLCGYQKKPNQFSGKTVTEHHEYPWLVAFKYKKADGSPAGYRCSGTIINHRYVLTAAKCLEPNGYELTDIVVGEWDFSATGVNYDYYEDKSTTIPRRQSYPVVEKIAHPYFNNESGNNDIALVRLEKKITYNDYVRPICLPPRDFFPPLPGGLMETTGWDANEEGELTGTKVKANFTMVSKEECNTTFPKYNYNHPNKICVKTAEGSHIFDSGRPLMRNYVKNFAGDARQWFQEGILYNQPPGCSRESTTVLYMRLSRFITWILNNIRKS